MAIADPRLDNVAQYQPRAVKIINGRAIAFRDICVHIIRMGDVEDPDIFVAEPIWKWQQTDAGKWVMSNAVESPYYVQDLDPLMFGYRYRIIARLSEENITYWHLKFNQEPS